MTSESHAFAQTLFNEREAIVQFIELLTLEQASLRRGASDDLLDLSARKEQLAAKLIDIAAQRCKLLEESGFSTDRKGVEAWCAKHPDAQATAHSWADILALAGEARELQQVNGKLIEIHLQYNARALEALQGTKKPLDLYGPDGQSKTAGEQRINHSV